VNQRPPEDEQEKAFIYHHFGMFYAQRGEVESVSLAEQICKWYQEWQSAHSQKLHNVVIYNPDTGERLFLEQATIEEIAEILKALE